MHFWNSFISDDLEWEVRGKIGASFRESIATGTVATAVRTSISDVTDPRGDDDDEYDVWDDVGHA